MNYTILLILCALNLGLLWLKTVRRVSYQRLRERVSPGPLLSLLLVTIPVIFLMDLAGIDPPNSPGQWVNLMLFGVLALQVEALSERPVLMSNHLALLATSLGLTVILLELIFVFFLLDSRTPKTETEFFRLMTSNAIRKSDSAWPRPIPFAKPPGTFRILGLSDSFGTSGGITSNYHYQLEDLLRRDMSPAIQMVNISVPGYDTIHELEILRRFGMAYSPDLVLHGFFVGNDFSLYGDQVDVYTYLGIPAGRSRSNTRYRPRNFLSRDWIQQALFFLQERRRTQNELALDATNRAASYSKSSYLTMQFRRMNGWAKPTDKDVQRIQKVFPVLDAIRLSAEQGGARYVMVIHPDQTQVDDTLRHEILTTFQANEHEYDFELPQRVLRAYCADRGIQCLDLLPIFRAKANEGALYLLRDTHYNHTGDGLAAASIAQFLPL